MSGLSRRGKQAAENKEAVLLAIAHYGRARTGEILDYVNKDLNKTISERAVQDWLSRLEKEGSIVRNKYNVCYLTEKGRDIRLYAETCGKKNFNRLFSIHLSGSVNEDLGEIIHRFGFLIVWHFMFAFLPEASRKDKPEADAFVLRWVQDSIPIMSMFDAFMKRFGSKTKSRFYKHMIDEDAQEELFSLLYKNHPQAFKAMMDSWSEILTEILKEQEEDQKIFKEMERLFNEGK